MQGAGDGSDPERDGHGRAPPAARSAAWLQEHPEPQGRQGLGRADSGMLPPRLTRNTTGSSLGSLSESEEADAPAPSAAGGAEAVVGAPPRAPPGGGGGAGSSVGAGAGAPASPFVLPPAPGSGGSAAGAAAARLRRVTPMPGDASPAESRASQRTISSLPSLSEAEYEATMADHPPDAGTMADHRPDADVAVLPAGQAGLLRRVTPMPGASPAHSTRAPRGAGLPSLSEAGGADDAGPDAIGQDARPVAGGAPAAAARAEEAGPGPGGVASGGAPETGAQLTAGSLAAPLLQRLTPMPPDSLTPSARSQRGSLPSLSEVGSEEARSLAAARTLQRKAQTCSQAHLCASLTQAGLSGCLPGPSKGVTLHVLGCAAWSGKTALPGRAAERTALGQSHILYI